jgi:hypothetical protein
MVVVVMARFVPAQEAVRVKVALGLLDGHGDDSPTGQTGQRRFRFGISSA